jgi:hypothetical protein
MTYPGSGTYPDTTLFPETAAARFMQTTLGSGARLSVELAFGADINANPADWIWWDVTSDVRQSSQVQITIGRSGEAGATQPATCQLRLDNASGDYSLGPQSRHWPYIRRNTPVRVRVDPQEYGNAFSQVFLGFADGFTPAWSDVSGNDGYVSLSASGTLRRLAQGSSPVLSSLRRAVTDLPSVVAYWPCEDGKSSTSFASAFPGDPAMLISGTAEQPYPKFASDDSFHCSQPLPEVALTAWRGRVPNYSPTGEVQLRWLMKAPKLLNGTTCRLLSLQTTGTVTRWDVLYTNADGGDLAVKAYSATGALLLDTGSIQFNANLTARMHTLGLRQSGGNVFFELAVLPVGYASGGYYSGTITGQTVQAATAVTVAPDQGVDDTIMGHFWVQSQLTNLFSEIGQLNANVSETADVRLKRLCRENSVPLTVVGTSKILMGEQRVDTLINLLRECELADQGVLYDGVDAGLTYICGSHRLNQAPVITIDATRGDLAKELAPVDDDQRNVNRCKADRKDGGSAVVSDDDGPAGTAAIGIYDTSLTVNIDSDGDIADYAGWAVHQGTWTDNYRYPKLQLNLARDPGQSLTLGAHTYLGPATVLGGPTIAQQILAARLSSRIDVTGLSTIRPGQLPDGPLSSLLEGYSMTIDQFTWDVQLNLSPYAPWQVGELTAGEGDAREHALRLNPDGSILAGETTPGVPFYFGASTFLGQDVYTGSANLLVWTPNGVRWTTDAIQFPLDIEVGGLRLTVLGITGTGVLQTFLIAPPIYSKTLPDQTPVNLWQPFVLGV